MKDASVEKVALDRIYDDFCEQLQPENVVVWIQQVVAWEKDPSLPSPYHIPSDGEHTNSICLPALILLYIRHDGS